MDLIRDTDLSLLESIMERVCPMLKEKIKNFKAQHGKLQKVFIPNVTCNDKCRNEEPNAQRQQVYFQRGRGRKS